MHHDGPLVLSEIQRPTNWFSRASPTADQKSTQTPTRPRTDILVSDTCARGEIIYIESSDEGESFAASKPGPLVGLQPRERLMQTTQLTTPPSRAYRASASLKQWNKTDLTKALLDLLNTVRHDHSRLVTQAIEATTPSEWRVQHGADLFKGLDYGAVPHRRGETMGIKFKQHFKTGTDARREHHGVKRIKTTRERVPRYRFHHIDIRKNVLAPNTMLTFVPHLRDLDHREEPKYDSWLKELEDIDTKSGFKPMDREEKAILTAQTERAATLSLYLDIWLEKLGVAHCTRAALVAYMASQEPDEVSKPRRKSGAIQSTRETTAGSPTSHDSSSAAALFAGAFKQAFGNNDLPRASKIDLRRILLLGESVDGNLAPKLVAKDADSVPQGDMDELTEAHLAAYTNLGCLICYSHSCDHGEYDMKNLKRAFSMGAVMPLGELLKQRRRKFTPKSADAMITVVPCRRTCHRSPTSVGEMLEAKPWPENEVVLLKSIFSVLGQSQLQHDPICFAADILDRDCSAVFSKWESLAVKVPSVIPLEPLQVRPLPWYCNRRKVLRGEWHNHTKTHEHQRREIVEPCSHEGVCTQQNCPCVNMDILCEKWCRCTAETCSYKFTGCGCHAPGVTGKSCQAKGKGKPCICVQLNRECDPTLCQSCGVPERADPHNAESYILRETGCQNCELQRGSSTKLLLGQSRLDGVGYGLFTAQDIAQDDFVIEYVGELITHDEGVRREARRSDVFDEESSISYIFTLLEHEGIWLDAAVYGNLSRYINHASGTDSNVTPRILYVNGEYRIKFTALQDIPAGGELFFDYGENFPNLTKKLLDTKMTEKPVRPRKPRRLPQSAAGKIVARKAPKPEQKKMRRKKPAERSRRRRTAIECGEEVMQESYVSALNRPVKRRRGVATLDSGDNSYRTRGL